MHLRQSISAAAAAIVSVLLAAGLAGCGDVTFADGGPGGSDAGDGGGGPDAMIDPCNADELSIDDYYGCVAAAAATLYDHCVGDATAVDFNGTGDIQLIGELSIPLARAYLPDAIAAGVLSYDPAGAAACVALIRDLDCGRLFVDQDILAPCRDFIGTVAESGTCYSRLDCLAPNSQCQKANGSGNARDICLPGMCVAPTALGASCAQSGRCVPGAHCVDGVCASGDVGTGCRSSCAGGCDSDCDGELYCNVTTCTAAVADGDACSRDEQCGIGSRCFGESAGAGTCVNVRVEGAQCDAAGLFSCVGQLYCAIAATSTTGTCELTPRLGDPCGVGDFCPSIDRPLLSCDATSHTCELPGGVGSACTESAQCQHRLFCTNEIDGTPTGTCSEPNDAGGPCMRDRHCSTGICGPDNRCIDYTSCF